MKVIGDRLRQEHPTDNERLSRRVVQSFTAGMIDPGMDQILGMIQIGALLVLAIGGANIANLLLARGGIASAKSRCGWRSAPAARACCASCSSKARCSRRSRCRCRSPSPGARLRILKSTMPARILPFVAGLGATSTSTAA